MRETFLPPKEKVDELAAMMAEAIRQNIDRQICELYGVPRALQHNVNNLEDTNGRENESI